MKDSFFLFEAIKDGDLNSLKWIVENEEVDLNKNFEGNYPLELAVCCNDVSIAKYLVKKGAHIEHVREGFLWTIFQSNYVLVKFLLTCGIDPNLKRGEPIITAVLNKDVDMVKLLVENGADFRISEDKPLRIAKEQNDQQMLNYIDELASSVFIKTPLDLPEQCVICFDQQPELWKVPCKSEVDHLICKDCRIDIWCFKKCPICRADF